jgi:hypothetical protein
MKLAIELHPNEAWLWGNLASMQEDFGDKEEAIRSSEKVASMLANDKGVEQSYNQRVLRSAQERIKRLRK